MCCGLHSRSSAHDQTSSWQSSRQRLPMWGGTGGFRSGLERCCASGQTSRQRQSSEQRRSVRSRGLLLIGSASRTRERPPQGHVVKPFPENHVSFQPGDKRYRVQITADRHCTCCKAEAKRDGHMGMRHGNGHSSDWRMRLMPDGSEPQQSTWACTPHASDTVDNLL